MIARYFAEQIAVRVVDDSQDFMLENVEGNQDSKHVSKEVAMHYPEVAYNKQVGVKLEEKGENTEHVLMVGEVVSSVPVVVSEPKMFPRD